MSLPPSKNSFVALGYSSSIPPTASQSGPRPRGRNTRRMSRGRPSRTGRCAPSTPTKMSGGGSRSRNRVYLCGGDCSASALPSRDSYGNGTAGRTLAEQAPKPTQRTPPSIAPSLHCHGVTVLEFPPWRRPPPLPLVVLLLPAAASYSGRIVPSAASSPPSPSVRSRCHPRAPTASSQNATLVLRAFGTGLVTAYPSGVRPDRSTGAPRLAKGDRIAFAVALVLVLGVIAVVVAVAGAAEASPPPCRRGGVRHQQSGHHRTDNGLLPAPSPRRSLLLCERRRRRQRALA